MKLKGDLDSIGLGELFRTLAEQHAVGILSVVSPMGEKYISIQEGGISILGDKLAERTLLGDLLVARGYVTESQMQEVLRIQRDHEPRARLGELLLKKEFIDQQRIKDALKFQMEEEIFDLYTWKNASFEFDSEKTIGDLAPAGGLDLPQQAYLDPQALIVETSRRMPEWQEIQQRLPTPYLCFKLTPKCEEMLSRATRQTAVIIKFLKEGRTLETTVKRSCLGRFLVSKTLIKMLDDGWIFPYPAGELRMLASEHRAQKHFADALYIYRRMLETSQSEGESAQIQQLIDDTTDTMLRARAAGNISETTEAYSHKAAAERYRRRQKLRFVALILFAIAGLIASVFMLLLKYAPIPQLPEAYCKAISESDTAVASGQFERAWDIWRILYSSLPDKDTETAKRVMERLKALPRQYENHLASLLQPYEHLEKSGKLDEAGAGYQKLLDAYPRSPLAGRMKDGLARVADARAARQRDEVLSGFEAKLQTARQLIQQKQLSVARTTLTELLAVLPETQPLRQEVQAELKVLAGVETRVGELAAQGEEHLRKGEGEQALAAFDGAMAEWPDLPAADKARQESQRLHNRLEMAEQALKRADLAVVQGDLPSAVKILSECERNFGEFKAAAGLGQRIAGLSASAAAVQAQLDEARAEYALDKTRGRTLFANLIRQQAGFLIGQKIELPVMVISSPEATLSLGGKVLGPTPREVLLPVSGGVPLVFERSGYQRLERPLARLMPDDLEIVVKLKREPLRVIGIQGAVFAPPQVVNDCLCVLHGTELSVFDPAGVQRLWTAEKLFDDKQTSRRPSSGTGADELAGDLSWWYPRVPPEALNSEEIVLPLRSREVLRFNMRNSQAKRLLTLPCEPVGQPAAGLSPLLGGKSTLLLACADGKIRACNPLLPSDVQWERPLDPVNPMPKGALASGLVLGPNGVVLALSCAGRLTAFSVADGREQWSLDLKSPVSEGGWLPSGGRGLAAIVHTGGAVSAVDLDLHEKVWHLPVQRAMDETVSAAASSKSIYTLTRQGTLLKFSRESASQPLWRKPLDGGAALRLVLGRYLYAVSSFGTVYAIAPEDGHVVWDFRPESKPVQIGVFKDYLYLITADSRLLIMNAE